MKKESLLQLARLRQSTRMDGYACLGDFHGGLYECEHVSPWTKSGANVDAKVMVIGQDWLSADGLAKDPPDTSSAELGFDPNFPTNSNLDDLLKRHFQIQRSACYMTNLFPFIKKGNASAPIPLKHLKEAAIKFTLPEIRIVSPRLAICLGLKTFIGLMRATGRKDSLRLAEAIESPFEIANTKVHCVAHTGVLGMNNRGRVQVELDWQRLARSL